MIVALSTLSSRRRDQSNRWRLAPLRSSMRLIHINGLFVVVAQFCALVAINCCCHCRSLSQLDIGHEYSIDDVVVLLSLLASLMRHRRHSPHRCRLRLQGCLVFGVLAAPAVGGLVAPSVELLQSLLKADTYGYGPPLGVDRTDSSPGVNP